MADHINRNSDGQLMNLDVSMAESLNPSTSVFWSQNVFKDAQQTTATVSQTSAVTTFNKDVTQVDIYNTYGAGYIYVDLDGATATTAASFAIPPGTSYSFKKRIPSASGLGLITNSTSDLTARIIGYY